MPIHHLSCWPWAASPCPSPVPGRKPCSPLLWDTYPLLMPQHFTCPRQPHLTPLWLFPLYIPFLNTRDMPLWALASPYTPSYPLPVNPKPAKISASHSASSERPWLFHRPASSEPYASPSLRGSFWPISSPSCLSHFPVSGFHPPPAMPLGFFLSLQALPLPALFPLSSTSLFLSFDHPEHPVQWS